jgi:hypothetical protein
MPSAFPWQPFSRLHAKLDAVDTRTDRGGPLIGRSPRSPRVESELSAIESQRSPRSRKESMYPSVPRPRSVKPAWDDSTGPTYLDMPIVSIGRRPLSQRSSPRSPSPEAMFPQHPFLTTSTDGPGSSRPGTSPAPQFAFARGFKAFPLPVPPSHVDRRPVTSEPSPRARARQINVGSL